MKSFRSVFASAALLLVFMHCAAIRAKEYRIDSQKRFDALREAAFSPGDAILFKKGLALDGTFAPSGSGTEDAPITIRTYGDGHRPIIRAGGKHVAGLLLRNASFWEVGGLEITNTDGTDADQGTLFGIYVLAEKTDKTQRHVYIDDW